MCLQFHVTRLLDPVNRRDCNVQRVRVGSRRYFGVPKELGLQCMRRRSNLQERQIVDESQPFRCERWVTIGCLLENGR